jgi:regulator of sirC expression with transglutaminase-like and TPR domain
MMDRGRSDQLRQAIADNSRLDRTAAVIATVDPSAPPVDDIIAELDQLADGIVDPSPAALLRYVFSTLGFAGNMNRYYQPSNSLLHRVLDTRMGNPLSLSIVTVELSRRAGGTLRVVGFPGHVLIGDDDHPSRWFDPFLGGAGMDLAGCRSLLARMRPGEVFHPSMVRPSTVGELAERILNNLDVAYRQSGQISRLADVAELRLGLPSAGHGERRQLAHMLIAAGRVFQAADVLAELAEADPANGEEYDAIRQRLLAQRN